MAAGGPAFGRGDPDGVPRGGARPRGRAPRGIDPSRLQARKRHDRSGRQGPRHGFWARASVLDGPESTDAAERGLASLSSGGESRAVLQSTSSPGLDIDLDATMQLPLATTGGTATGPR